MKEQVFMTVPESSTECGDIYFAFQSFLLAVLQISYFILLHRPIVLNPAAFHIWVCCQYLALLVATKVIQISVFPLSHFHLVIYAASYHVLYLFSRQLIFLFYF